MEGQRSLIFIVFEFKSALRPILLYGQVGSTHVGREAGGGSVSVNSTKSTDVH